MTRPRFSVIIPTLNEEKFLPNLLQSLVDQTQKPFEVIVVDGRSRDKTVTKAQAFIPRLPSLNVVEAKRKNVSLQRNIGGQMARGEWLVFIDADSQLFPYFFDGILRYIDANHPSFVTTWFAPDGPTVSNALYALVGNLYFESSMAFHRPLAPGPLTIVKKDLFERVGGYNETLSWGEDHDFTKRVVALGHELAILRETLYVYSQRRIHANGALSFLKTYIPATLLVLLTNKNFSRMPGYIMGGQLYGKRKPLRRSVLKNYEAKLKKLVKELFE